MMVQSGKERTLPDGQTVHSQKPGHSSDVTAALEEGKKNCVSIPRNGAKEVEPLYPAIQVPNHAPKKKATPICVGRLD